PPGCSPADLNCETMQSTDLVSPGVAGARPSKAFEASVSTWDFSRSGSTVCATAVFAARATIRALVSRRMRQAYASKTLRPSSTPHGPAFVASRSQKEYADFQRIYTVICLEPPCGEQGPLRRADAPEAIDV